ncbi:MAG: hypothetical protein ACFE8L_10385 [Candidatus Hodarchaeota archaeon]
MSYIEKKYLDKINQIFKELPTLERILLKILNQKSVKNVDEVAKLCAEFNKNINLILKKYYPEVKEMNDKLVIKSFLKFYYDLIDKLTDLVRNIENFQKIDQEYYNTLIAFIEDKENLISGKYKFICTRELTAFYDQNSRNSLEKILAEKLKLRSREFFTFGSLEVELKKIATITGASKIEIKPASNLDRKELDSAQSIINIALNNDQDGENLYKIGEEIKKFLVSKGYKAVYKHGKVITNAVLLSDS